MVGRGERGHDRRHLGPLPLLLASLLIAAGCAQRIAARGPGLVPVVGRGENLFRIGKAYGVDYRELARANDIADPAKIEVGQRVFVPGATRHLPVEIIAPVSVTER